MDQKTIEYVYDLIDDIKDSETFKAYKKAQQALESSVELSALIESFQQAKSKYEAAKQYGTYHPDLNTYKSQLSDCKTKLYTHPLYQDFKACEKTLNAWLDDMAITLAKTVSPNITVDVSHPFHAQGGQKTCKKESH